MWENIIKRCLLMLRAAAQGPFDKRRGPVVATAERAGRSYCQPRLLQPGNAPSGEEKPETTVTAIPSLFRQPTQTGDTAPVAELGNSPSSEQADSAP